MKKTLVFLMVIFLTIGACGCNMKGQDKIDRMLAYINSKYTDDSFTYESMSGGHLGSNVTKIIVNSEKYPEKEIRVICSEVGGTEVFTDTYLNVKFENQTYVYIKNALIDKFGENIYLKYIPDDTACMENGTSNTTFSEYISNQSTFIYFSAAVCSSVIDENEAIESIKQLFADSVVRAHIYFIDEDVTLTGYSGASNALEYIENKTYCKKLYFTKETVDKYSKIEWTDGV